MTKILPEIRIKDAWLLRQNASFYLNELWGDGEPLYDDDYYEKIAKAYSDAWKPYETKILEGLTSVLGLTFRQNIIDVYIAPWFAAFSDPLVIGVVSEPDLFIDLLTHELIHKLLTDNTLLEPESNLVSVWEKLYGKNHTFNTLLHVPVHAVHKAIYLDVLKAPERLKRDLQISQENEPNDYLKAWEYVDKIGYKNIINQLKKSYKDLSKMAN